MEKDLFSTDMEIFEIGTHNGDKYTHKDLDAMVEAFNTLKDKWRPTLKIGHSKKAGEQPALGYVDKLRRAGGVLIARVSNIPAIIKQAIEKGLYKKRSAEIYWNYKDGKKKWPRVLKAIALLGESIPAVSSLKDIEKFFGKKGENIMKQIVKTYDFNMGGEEEVGIGETSRKVDSEVKKYMLLHDPLKKMSYEKVLEIVLELDPDLKEEYTKID